MSDSAFVKNGNGPAEAGILHSIYAAHGSNDVRVTGSRFTIVSGDPIRLRDDSNGASVSQNVFDHAGSGSYVSDWYGRGERQSFGSVVTRNTLLSGYSGASIRASRCFDSPRHICSPDRIQDGANMVR